MKGKNRTLIFALINLILFVNVQCYFSSAAFPVSSLCLKKNTSKATSDSNKTNSADASIVDEDETNETELHPACLTAHFSYYNFNTVPNDKTLRHSLWATASIKAFQRPVYLVNRLFLI